MHVCMISSGYYPILPTRRGAIEPFVYGLSNYLARTNRVDVFGIGEGTLKEGNMRVHTFPYNVNTIDSIKKVIGMRLAYQIPYNVCLLNAIVHLHKKDPIDILHMHDANSGFVGTLCKLSLGIPFVCSIHNELKAILPIKYCDRVLAVSNYIRTFLIEKRNLTPDKIAILNVAIDCSSYGSVISREQAKAELGLSGYSVILFVGRKCPEKGPQILIEAIKKLVNNYPNILAILVGPDYNFMINSVSVDYTDYLKHKAKNLSIEKHVLFEGFVSNTKLNLYYAAADVCVFPSIWNEAFGLVILESLALKRSVIASRIGGIPEIINNEENGLLTTPGDPQEIADAIDCLLSNKIIASRLANNGYDSVTKRFSYEVIGKRCFEIYKEIITNKKSSE